MAAGYDPARIGYVLSRLGFDYHATLPAPLAEILSQGEPNVSPL